MTEPILDTQYWKNRLESAVHPHHAIFKCGLDKWQLIEAKHREILKRTIGVHDSVLDVGCGWGRLLTLLRDGWLGNYFGIDISPDFIELAETNYPHRFFSCIDARIMNFPYLHFDWAVLISIRPMVRRNLGDEDWGKMESRIREMANRILFLEYDESDEGSVE